MPITIKQDDILNATEQYICCIACSSEKKINAIQEPNLARLWTKFPYANAYSEHKKLGKRWKLGSIEFFKEDNNKTIMTIFSRLYPGTCKLPGDDTLKRKKWFKEALKSLSTYSDLKSIALDEVYSF